MVLTFDVAVQHLLVSLPCLYAVEQAHFALSVFAMEELEGSLALHYKLKLCDEVSLDNEVGIMQVYC